MVTLGEEEGVGCARVAERKHELMQGPPDGALVSGGENIEMKISQPRRRRKNSPG